MPNPSKSRLDEIFLAIRGLLRASVQKILSRPQDVEDVVQETYLRAVANNTTKSIQDPEGYLFRTSRNIALNEKAKLFHRLERAVPVEELDQIAAFSRYTPVENDVLSKQRFAEYCLALSELPVGCRKVVVLRKVYGFSQKEIAEKMGISISTVESHITNGMQRTNQFMRTHVVEMRVKSIDRVKQK